MKKKNAGFSLVELIIVIAIMAVLIGVLAPQYIKFVEKSKKAKDEQTARGLHEAAILIATDEDYYTSVPENASIRFDASGVTTSNSYITSVVEEYIPGCTSEKVESGTYKDKYYQIKFISHMGDYRLAISEGWY